MVVHKGQAGASAAASCSSSHHQRKKIEAEKLTRIENRQSNLPEFGFKPRWICAVFNAFLIPKAKRRGVVETIFFGQKTAILFFKTVRRQNPEFEQGRGEDADGGSRVCRDANGVGLSCERFQKGRLRRTPTRHSSGSDAGRVKAVSRVLRTHHSSKGEGSAAGG